MIVLSGVNHLKTHIRNKRAIKNILILLVSAILCGGLLTGFFLYVYGPTGYYLTGNILLNPSIIEKINYQDKDLDTGLKVHFMFDHTDVSFFDLKSSTIKQKELSTGEYASFFQVVSSDKSLENASPQVIAQFRHSQPLLLTTVMQVAEFSKTSKRTQVFQQAQILEDHYRIYLPGQGDKKEWVYFSHPGIYKKLMQVFNFE